MGGGCRIKRPSSSTFMTVSLTCRTDGTDHGTAHVTIQSVAWKCQWDPCLRRGQIHNSHEALIAHVRPHTGERPFICPVACASTLSQWSMLISIGCQKSFIRVTGLDKHMGGEHALLGPQATLNRGVKSKRGSLIVAPAPSASYATSTITSERVDWKAQRKAEVATREELEQDPDLADVIPRLANRKTFWHADIRHAQALHEFRKRFPRSSGDAEVDSGVLSDDNAAQRYPPVSQLHTTMPDPADARFEALLFTRSRWQVRYIMAKAKLMLVEEENVMRRNELSSVLQVEQSLAGVV